MSTTDQHERPAVTWRPSSFLAFGLLITAVMVLSYLAGAPSKVRSDIAKEKAATQSALRRVAACRHRDDKHVAQGAEALRTQAIIARAFQRHYATSGRSAFVKDLHDHIAAIPGISQVEIAPKQARPPSVWPVRGPPGRVSRPRSRRRIKPKIKPVSELLPLPYGDSATLLLQVTCWCERKELYRALMALDTLDLPGAVVGADVRSMPDQADHLRLEFVYCVDVILGSRRTWTVPTGRITQLKNHISPELAKTIAQARSLGTAPAAAALAGEEESKKVRISRIILSKRYPAESVAIANGYALRAGDKMSGMLVEKIEADGIVLRKGPKLIKVEWERRQNQ